MRAVVVCGLGEVAVETVEDARVEAPTDALLRVWRPGSPQRSARGSSEGLWWVGDAKASMMSASPCGVGERASEGRCLLMPAVVT
jgi:hypothetical protein